MRAIVLGNAGSGKTTMARRLIGSRDIPLLSLDQITWHASAVRKPRTESLNQLFTFIRVHEEWIIEGCYGDLVEAALPHGTELHFLNPGVDICVANCLSRPWEPDKYASPARQNDMLPHLVDWVRQYETRDDEFGYTAHRRLFESFRGRKREYTTLDSYDGT